MLYSTKQRSFWVQDPLQLVLQEFFGDSPHLLGYPLVSRVYERLSLWFVPLIVCSILWFEQSRIRSVVWLGLGFLLLSTSCAAYAYYAGVILILLECSKWRAWRERWTLWSVLSIPLVVAFYSGYLSQSEWSLAPQL